MATNAELNDRLTKVEVWAKAGGTVATLIVLGWMSWLSVTLHGLSGDVRALKQAAADRGTQIVGQIESPSSPAKLKASLASLAADVQMKRAKKQAPEPAQMRRDSNAVSTALIRDPDVPEAWRAAAQLISFRSPLPAAGQIDCLRKPVTATMVEPPSPSFAPGLKVAFVVSLGFQDCTLNLDDEKSLDQSEAGRILSGWQAKSVHPIFVAWSLTRVHVVYHGGPILEPTMSFSFQDCTFDLELDGAPPTPGRMLVQALLHATDLRLVQAPLQVG